MGDFLPDAAMTDREHPVLWLASAQSGLFFALPLRILASAFSRIVFISAERTGSAAIASMVSFRRRSLASITSLETRHSFVSVFFKVFIIPPYPSTSHSCIWGQLVKTPPEYIPSIPPNMFSQDEGRTEGRSSEMVSSPTFPQCSIPVSYTHLRAHETRHDLVCRLLLEKK